MLLWLVTNDQHFIKARKINSQSRTDVKLSESKYQKLKYRKQRRYGQLPLFLLSHFGDVGSDAPGDE